MRLVPCAAALVAALLLAAQPWAAAAQGPAAVDGALPAPEMGDSRAAASAEAGADAGSGTVDPGTGQPSAADGPVTALPETQGTVVPSAAGVAVSSPVLTINEAALYAGSAWGRRVQAALERLSRELSTENDRIYDELAAQEDALTALRATLPPAEFRERAEAFDAHAQQVRAERQAVVRDLNDMAETERQNFLAVSVPILAEVMAERGATVILDQRMVFVSADAVDVTETLIARIDAEIGAGPVPQP